ncbi:zf-HC2 domain-containing protein [Actinoplanes sp. LDG1-06]|uniref:Zf-HC2 domain-containing protein n=1 Tax=Paractinoplanes ovalisporus TaxID=2810368 RepID=A0ABS2ADU0_9ACTN|nr:zf-HC2 domain-containing protein [Actinoplanes ovalisporus]MBM2617992.1 zf-HC2 domain-containing protein [Actinoplanes ovalisporus]
MHCEHEHDDGAYVLGALSPAERAAYEGHLATCSFCREAVADISALPDLLSRLDAKEFAKLLDPSLTSGEGHPGAAFRDWATSEWQTLASDAKRRTPDAKRRKNGKAFRVRALSTAAAAVLVALIGLGVFAWTRDNAAADAPPSGPAVAMTAVQRSSPVSASVRLTSTSGGTKVDLVCSYSAEATRPYTFTLIAYGPDEEKESLGSWKAIPGAEFEMPGVTHFGIDSLSRLELVQYDGKALLAYDVP